MEVQGKLWPKFWRKNKIYRQIAGDSGDTIRKKVFLAGDSRVKYRCQRLTLILKNTPPFLFHRLEILLPLYHLPNTQPCLYIQEGRTTILGT